MINSKNIFNLPSTIPDEIVETLHSSGSVRIERIISSGQVSPEGFWYDQAENEWVMLVQGEAKVAFDDGTAVSMNAGDYIFIPARRRHRVEFTNTEPPCVWVCVFF